MDGPLGDGQAGFADWEAAGEAEGGGGFLGARGDEGAAGMLSGPHQKFAEGIAKGLNSTEAYLEAYPRVKRNTAWCKGSVLRRRPAIQAEIARIRKAAEDMLGSAKLTLVEKRDFLARVVRARVAEVPVDSELWDTIKPSRRGTKYQLPNKLLALHLDNVLAGEGAKTGGGVGGGLKRSVRR